MDTVISLRGAVAVLGRFPALAGVDLDVGRSEILLVSGSNGAGKSTMLRLCAGLLPLAQGRGHVLGFDLRRQRREVRRRVGYLGHANGLYPELTPEENVRFWARSAGAAPSDASAALDRVELGSRVRPLAVAQLSAGQRRRTALACLVVRRPELWLLDEPYTGLDTAARDVLDRLLHEAVAGAATVLVASHEHDRSAAMATREIRLAGGVVAGGGNGPAAEAGSGEPAEGRRPGGEPADGRPTGRVSRTPTATVVGGGGRVP
jgi:heme ABC exporter ATP-binding subunit CcmA